MRRPTLEQVAVLFPGAATTTKDVADLILKLVEDVTPADDPDEETDERILAARTIGALWVYADIAEASSGD